MPVPDPRGNGRGNGAVQLVVTDLDGSLSDAAERIHPASVQAIRDLAAAGIPVLVATGRRLRMACAVLEAGGLTGPAVVLDGALGLDLRDGRVFHQVAFPPAAARQVLEAFGTAGLSPCVYVGRPGVDLVVAERPSTHPDHLDRPRPCSSRSWPRSARAAAPASSPTSSTGAPPSRCGRPGSASGAGSWPTAPSRA